MFNDGFNVWNKVGRMTSENSNEYLRFIIHSVCLQHEQSPLLMLMILFGIFDRYDLHKENIYYYISNNDCAAYYYEFSSGVHLLVSDLYEMFMNRRFYTLKEFMQ